MLGAGSFFRCRITLRNRLGVCVRSRMAARGKDGMTSHAIDAPQSPKQRLAKTAGCALSRGGMQWTLAQGSRSVGQ
jgi:hypothetical protein